MIPLKSCQDIECMRQAGKVLAAIMQEAAQAIKPGVTTAALDNVCVESMRRHRVQPAFKGYHGYPANICVSVNETVVHGIPGTRRLEKGDIVSLDMGIVSNGLFVDMAKTFPVGKIDEEKERLIEVCRQSLERAILAMKPANRLSDVGWAVQELVEANGFSVVRDFVGHGIGRALHEEPQVPNFGAPNKGPMLTQGMVFAIEPMINAGGWEVEICEDGWTVVTKDRRPSAHFEHTVAITEHGPEVLTRN